MCVSNEPIFHLALLLLDTPPPCACLRCLVAQSCLALCYPMGFCSPGSSVRGISQARILEWAAVASPTWKGNKENNFGEWLGEALVKCRR